MTCIEIVTTGLIVAAAIVGYVLRIERQLSTISSDLCWIKKLLKQVSCIKTTPEQGP